MPMPVGGARSRGGILPVGGSGRTHQGMTIDVDLEHSGPAAPTAPPVTDPTAVLAGWLERRLDQTTDWTLDEARLYGVTLREADLLATDAPHAARYCLLDRGYPYDVIDGPASLLAANFDAVALVTLGWQSPLDDAAGSPVRPSRHPKRERVRVVSVARIEPTADAAALATAVRVRGAASADLHVEGAGRMADALRNLAAEALAGLLASDLDANDCDAPSRPDRRRSSAG